MNYDPSYNPLTYYNLYKGATSGNPVGEARAALGAAKLYGNLSGDPNLSGEAGGALNALGIYQGLQQGGWQGDTEAAASAAQLAGNYLGSSALSGVGSGLMIPLSLYNEIENYQSGNTASDAMAGAETGAAVGSVIPVIGTAVGGIVGGALGALSSAFGPGETDPETIGVQHIIDAESSHGNNPAIAASVKNPYLGLAGLMDERSSTLPEYQQYGRMGEQRFSNDLVKQINDAFTSGIDTGPFAGSKWSTDPNMKGYYQMTNPDGSVSVVPASQVSQSVYNTAISPWVGHMGSGYDNVGKEYTATNQGLIQDMVNQYMGGAAANNWTAIGGDNPFSDVYKNSPFAAQGQAYQQQLAQQQAQQAQQAQQTRQAMYGAMGRDAVNQFGHTSASERFSSGGHMAKRKSVLDQIRPSFKDVPHFSDGGGNDYVSYFTPTSDSGIPYADLNTYDNPQLSDVSQANNSPIPDLYSGNADQIGLGSINYGDNTNNSALGSGGILSGLGSLLGVSSMGQLVKQYGALAPLLAAALGGGSQNAKAPSTPQGYGPTNTSLPATSYNRTYTQPNVQNWYTYGEGPEQSFFSGNQIPTTTGITAANPPSSGAGAATWAGSSPGMANTQPIHSPSPLLRARGGAAFDSTQGDSYVGDPGHGDGTSDDIDAKLSGGEYVMDAGTVSMLGNGSNEAGARALDQLRHRIRQHAGKSLSKGKQFMKAKPAAAYLRGGKA